MGNNLSGLDDQSQNKFHKQFRNSLSSAIPIESKAGRGWLLRAGWTCLLSRHARSWFSTVFSAKQIWSHFGHKCHKWSQVQIWLVQTCFYFCFDWNASECFIRSDPFRSGFQTENRKREMTFWYFWPYFGIQHKFELNLLVQADQEWPNTNRTDIIHEQTSWILPGILFTFTEITEYTILF